MGDGEQEVHSFNTWHSGAAFNNSLQGIIILASMEPFCQPSRARTVGLPGSREFEMGWISRAILHPDLCANSLVADDTLKRSMATSTRNGYGASEMDVLPRSLEHMFIRGYTMPQDDVKSSLIVKLENSLMRPCVTRSIHL